MLWSSKGINTYPQHSFSGDCEFSLELAVPTWMFGDGKNNHFC